MWRWDRMITAESNAIASDNASLDDRVLLAGEGQGREAESGHEPRPSFNREEAKEAGCDIERWDDANSEVKLVGDDTKYGSQESTHNCAPQCDLLPPLWDYLCIISVSIFFFFFINIKI